jgi:hypothetical protein
MHQLKKFPVQLVLLDQLAHKALLARKDLKVKKEWWVPKGLKDCKARKVRKEFRDLLARKVRKVLQV